MNLRIIIKVSILIVLLSGKHFSSAEILKSYSLDSLDNLVDKDVISVDKEIKAEGTASIKIITDLPKVYNLFEIEDINVENAKVVYSAKIKTEDVKGIVYLEMWCVFNDKGEYFSRALHSPRSSTNDWTLQETPFFLKSGENPDKVKLNLVVNGKGTVWVDDIRFTKLPLK